MLLILSKNLLFIIVGEFFFFMYLKFTFFGNLCLIFSRCSPFSPTIVSKEICLQKVDKCLDIAAAPPRYSSVSISLKARIGSLPDFPNASQKIYWSKIVSPIIKTFIFLKESIKLLIFENVYFFLIFLINNFCRSE